MILILVLTFTSKKPIVHWINGLLGTCIYWKFNFAFRNFNFKCVHKNVLILTKKRFTLLGISQGGFIGRALLQICEVGKFIKRLIPINSPHNGIALLPWYSPQNSANDLFAHVSYADSSSTYFWTCSFFNSLKLKMNILRPKTVFFISIIKDVLIINISTVFND